MTKKNFLNAFSCKIKKINELVKIKKSSKNKFILCHGNFDVVHPGHIRHLLYAKSKANCLVVSITSDKHIKKGVYRPHVPQNLRALNLGALSCVDYVIIDDNPNPLNLIKKLKPEIYAKGYDYTSGKELHPDSKIELKTVKSYGGEMIFTPGDIVFSSTKIIGLKSPNIDYEKLINVMDENKITFKFLKKQIMSIRNKTVHIVGDTILDVHTKTTLIGGQVKTPTLSVLYQDKKIYLGGAAIVAQHLKTAGANVIFTTILGEDKNKKFVISRLRKKNIKINPIIIHTRPTTTKNVIIANDHRVLKIDNLDNQPISDEATNKISNIIKKTKSDCVIFSDFRHGLFHKNNISILTKSIPQQTVKIADSQVASRWGNISDFKKFDIIFPNEKEARFCLADQDSNISSLSRGLLQKTLCKNLVLKLSEKGAYGVVGNNAKYSFALPSFTKKPVDSVGAGDALLSYTVAIFLATKLLVPSLILGSIAAALECEVDGNLEIKPKEIWARLDDIERNKSL